MVDERIVMVKSLSNSIKYISPTMPVPDIDAIASLVEEMYSRGVAILLRNIP